MKGTNFDGVAPAVALLAAILRRAKLDAKRGDPFALLWLLSTGVLIADYIYDGAGAAVRGWCIAQLEQEYSEAMDAIRTTIKL